MIKLTYILISVLLICNLISAIEIEYFGHKVLRVHPETFQHVKELRNLESFNGVDFWDSIYANSTNGVRVMILPDQLPIIHNYLEKLYIRYNVIIEDVPRVLENEMNSNKKRRLMSKLQKADGDIDVSYFWNLDEIYNYLDDLAVRHPDLVTIETIGKSFEGRDIKAVIISLDGAASSDRPNIIMDATIHAREWIGPMVAIGLISELCENSIENVDIMSGLDWIIVPVANPDGYVYTHETDRLWRKTRKPVPGFDCIGVDPNRNFDFMWDYNPDPQVPCGLNYRGQYPASESEVQALSELFKRYDSTKLYVAIHSHGELLLYPYGYDEILIDNHADHAQLGERALDKLESVSGNDRYILGNSAKVLYKSCGSSDDYAVVVGKTDFGYTLELPGGGEHGFDIEADRIEEVIEETVPALKEMGQYIVEKYDLKRK